MTTRARIRRALPLALALTLACTGLARADAAYDRVAAAYAAAGGQLEACRFTQADLQAALDGIPAELKDVVPDLRRAIEDGIRAHEDGDCEGVEPTASGDAEPAPAAATPPVTTPTTPAGAAAPTTTAPAAPGATPPTVPAPGAAAPTPGADGAVTTPSRQPPGVPRDRTPLTVGAIALGAVALLVLALWGLAQARGWDPPWLARVRHAWAEAGYRASATWAEFADWLRLGR